MSFSYEIAKIISHNIFVERNIENWNEYKTNILNNFNNINFNEQIDNYIPCDRKLHITRPKMRGMLKANIMYNSNIFIEVGYGSYKPREQYDIKQNDIYDFIEECVKILVKKQQLK